MLACTGISGAVLFCTTTRSNGNFLPCTHCPPTSGVLATLGTGPWPQATGPTIVRTLVAAIASLIESFLSMSCARLSTSTATSKSASTYPSGCVHCLEVDFSHAAASSAELWCVSPDANGWCGDHQTSVVRPYAVLPIASTALGNSTAFAIEATLGLSPCCAACVQKF